jgi:hypothetical protein
MGYFSKVLVEVQGTSSFQYTGINADDLAKRVKTLFLSNGYKIKSENGNVFTFEKGTYGLRLLLGAFYKYFKFNVGVAKINENNCQVTITKATSGMSGGLIGMNQVKKEFSRIKLFLSTF